MKRLIVSIHDVSPLTRTTVEAILGDLGSRRIGSTSLLVIPHHHERAHMKDDPAFGQWLSGLAGNGHEIVIHGYTHQRAQRRAESASTRAITRVYTAGEGEFYDIAEADALSKVTRAQSEFREMGLSPEGFIAPAWLLGKEGERALRSTGIRYTTRLRTIEDFKTGRVTQSQSLVYSVRSGWRRWTSLRWNRFLNATLKNAPVLRLSIHPVDWQHPPIREQILEIASDGVLNRVPCTYLEYVNR